MILHSPELVFPYIPNLLLVCVGDFHRKIQAFPMSLHAL